MRILAGLVGISVLASSGLAITLNGNPGPANNGGSPGWAIFMDLTAGASNVNVTGMATANTGAAAAAFDVEVFTRTGTALGGPVGSGPGSSSAGWTSIGTAAATQGGTANGISNLIDIPDIAVGAGQTVGVAVLFRVVGPRYVTGTTGYVDYSDANLTLRTGDVRSVPFGTTGSFFTPRLFTGYVEYTVDPIPEPATLAILGLGGVAVLRRRRRA